MNLLDEIYLYHNSVIDELLLIRVLYQVNIDNSFASLKEYLSAGKKEDYDFEYDQVVSYGEILVNNYCCRISENCHA